MKALMIVAVFLIGSTAFAQETKATKGERKVGEKVEIRQLDVKHTSVVGIVHHLQLKNCSLWVEVRGDGGKMIRLLPTNLPEEFLKDGIRIVFDYLKTKDKVDPSCNIESAIAVSNVKELKRTVKK
ncbi:MAG: hypothetical protein JKY09_05270 [Crocinitomicaceae bacterium]|nr:hypothetical protein [Crocinitomicaceae bacterium]